MNYTLTDRTVSIANSICIILGTYLLTDSWSHCGGLILILESIVLTIEHGYRRRVV